MPEEQEIKNKNIEAGENEVEDISDLISTLPETLRTAYSSTRTSDAIYEANQSSNMPEDFYSDAAFLVGDVLLGALNPQNLVKELSGFGVDKVIAENFYRNISQSVFLHLQKELDDLYSQKPAEDLSQNPLSGLQTDQNQPPKNIPVYTQPHNLPAAPVSYSYPESKTTPSPIPSAQKTYSSRDPYRESISDPDKDGNVVNLK